MCFEIPEYVHLLAFLIGFLAIVFGFIALGMKLMPSERAPYPYDWKK